MACFSGPEIVNDGLVFHYDMNNRVKSWKGKPVENLVASGQRTCSSGLTRMAYHREAYTYVVGISAHGRKDVIKVTCSPTGTDSIAPYADFGFSVSRAGGSQIGDVYWISFDYKNIRGGDNPSIGIVYANGYKQPDAAVVGTFEPQITTDLENGWKRVTRKCTMTAAGASWWRFGQNSGNEEVEFYLDNFQIIHSDVDAPFVDGTRSNTEAIIDLTGNNVITAVNLTYNSDGSFEFDGTDDYLTSPNLNLSDHTLETWTRSHSATAGTGGNDLQSIIGSYTAAGGDLGKYTCITPYGANQFTFRIDDGVNSFREIATVSSIVNQWYHLVLTYNSDGTAKAYVNGSLVGTISFTSSIVFNSVPNDIGRSQNGTTYNGDISTAQIYNRALSADEIKQNFESTRTQYGV